MWDLEHGAGRTISFSKSGKKEPWMHPDIVKFVGKKRDRILK